MHLYDQNYNQLLSADRWEKPVAIENCGKPSFCGAGLVVSLSWLLGFSVPVLVTMQQSITPGRATPNP